MNITGSAKVYGFENKGKYAKASLKVGKKKNGEWEDMWFNAKFVGKNVPPSLEKGQLIEITSGTIESYKGEKGTIVTIVIFEFVGKDSVKNDTPFPSADESLPF